MNLAELAVTAFVAAAFAVVSVERARGAVTTGTAITERLERAERERDAVERQVHDAAWKRGFLTR